VVEAMIVLWQQCADDVGKLLKLMPTNIIDAITKNSNFGNYGFMLPS
jgi:hypothetical protein